MAVPDAKVHFRLSTAVNRYGGFGGFSPSEIGLVIALLGPFQIWAQVATFQLHHSAYTHAAYLANLSAVPTLSAVGIPELRQVSRLPPALHRHSTE